MKITSVLNLYFYNNSKNYDNKQFISNSFENICQHNFVSLVFLQTYIQYKSQNCEITRLILWLANIEFPFHFVSVVLSNIHNKKIDQAKILFS